MRRRGVAVLFASAGVACGGSQFDKAPPDAPADAGADVVVDAGFDSDQDPDVYPAVHHPMPLFVDYGGPVLLDPGIVTVTFVGDAWRDQLRTYDKFLVTSDWWKTVATVPFFIGPGTDQGDVELPDTVSGKLFDNDVDIKPFLQKEIASKALPTPDASTLYVLYFPAATTITLSGATSCVQFGGFHDNTTYTSGATSLPVSYVVVPRCDSTSTDDVTNAASHEIVEAATDPQPSTAIGWYMADDDAWTLEQAGLQGGAEVADVCIGRPPYTDNGYPLVRSWSNAAAKASHDPCQPTDPGKVFYSAAIDTHGITENGIPTDGYVIMAQGASEDVGVVIFSDAPLPSDVSLVAGARSNSTNPSDVAPIGLGITAALSRTSGHNGQAVTLTLTTSSNTPAGDYPFFVRAILTSPTDFHSWPAILRVQ